MTFFCRLYDVTYNRFQQEETDIYLFGNFDNYLDIYSPILKKTKDADWKKWTRVFEYKTQYPKHLEHKKLKLALYKPIFLWDLKLGEVEIDLHTLATAPKRFRLTCTLDGASVGVLEFTFAFKYTSDVHFFFENITFECNVLSGKKYYFYYCGSQTSDYETTERLDKEARKERQARGESEPPVDLSKIGWVKTNPLVTRLSWVDLMNEILTLRLDSGLTDSASSEANGVAFLYMVNILSSPKNNENRFIVPLVKTDKKTKEKTPIGQVTGTLKVQYEPLYCQMVGGYYHDGLVKDAIPFFPGLPEPKKK